MQDKCDVPGHEKLASQAADMHFIGSKPFLGELKRQLKKELPASL